MLNKIRKGADSFLVRMLMGFIALSFVGIGGVSFMNGNSRGDAVTFSDTDPISVERFMGTKAQEIEVIQKENGINLTDEQIAQLNLDNNILQRLISDSMIAYLARYYDFDISNDQLIKVVRQAPYFKNALGDFDANIFKSIFKNSKQKEAEYLEDLKSSLVKATMINVFMDSYTPPKLLTDNVINYMAETRVVDILKIDLNNKIKDWKASDPSDASIEEFYETHKIDYLIPELRSFNYIKASSKFMNKNLQLKDVELKEYYEENKEEFSSKSFTESKNEVREALNKLKLEELITELAKNFVEDIDKGLSFAEISEKYELEVISIENISKNSMNNNTNDAMMDIASTVFEMIEGEVSYPIELQEQNEILIVELKSISPARQQELAEVKDSIKISIHNKQLAQENIKILDQIKSGYKDSKSTINIKNKGVNIVKTNFVRAELPMNNDYQPNFLMEIFKTPPSSSTRIVVTNNEAYFAFIKSKKSDNKKVAEVKKESLGHISLTIREGIMYEIINYLTRKNDMQIKL
jgi:hypothetical protein